MAEYVMEARGIGKSFPGVRALDNIDINIKKGEVVALLGENGAGKSTLIKILSGVYQPDEGEIYLNGQRVVFEVPLAAKNAGIGVIHQELNYVASVSVAENIFIGSIPKKHGFVDYKKMYAEARQILSVWAWILTRRPPWGPAPWRRSSSSSLPRSFPIMHR